MDLPKRLVGHITDFGNSVSVIRTKCLDVYHEYAEDDSRCLQIDRKGDIVEVNKSLEFERAGLMDLWVPPKMSQEKDSYVFHCFCTLVEDMSLTFAEITNVCAGGENGALVFDGWMFKQGQYDADFVVKTISVMMPLIMDIDLSYTVKDFELPPFMQTILDHEKTISDQESEMERLREEMKVKDALLVKQVFPPEIKL